MTATLDPSIAAGQDRRYDTQIYRRKTRTVMVGDVPVGSDHPVVVQSMINEDTLDIEAAVRESAAWLMPARKLFG